MTTMYRFLLLPLLALGTNARAEWMNLDIVAKAIPPCMTEYQRFINTVQAERSLEQNILLKGIATEKDQSNVATLKTMFIHKILFNFLESESLKAFYFNNANENILIDSDVLYQNLIKTSEWASQIDPQSFRQLFYLELDNLNKLERKTKSISQISEFTSVLFESVRFKLWKIPTSAASELLTADLIPKLVTIMISASRIPPEEEWMNAIENKPVLLLYPELMKKLAFLQSGEDTHTTSCLTFERKSNRVQEASKQLFQNMRQELRSDILEALFPSPEQALGCDGKPVYVSDATYVYQDMTSNRVLPEWAKE